MAITHPPTTVPTGTDRLGCGRTTEQVWDHIDSPPDTHELTCPHCQAARASLAPLATATRQLIATDRADPTLRTSPDVLSSIVSPARAEVRRGRTIPLEHPADARATRQLTVSTQAVADVIRRTSDQIPGVEARRCVIRPINPQTLPDGPAAQSAAIPAVEVTVDLHISVTSTVAIPHITGLLRTRARNAVARQVGIAVTTMNIGVEDIHD